MPREKRQKAYESDSDSAEGDDPTLKHTLKKSKKKVNKRNVVAALPDDEPRVTNNNFASALQSALGHNSNADDANNDDNADDDEILTGTRTTQQRQADRLARKSKALAKREPRAQRLSACRQDTPAFGELEKRLSKVAASGVVQLFNALKRQRASWQRQVKLQSRDSEKDRVEIQPRSFLASLAAADAAKKQAKSAAAAGAQVKQESKWSVLRDDFLETKAKAWDADD